MEEKDILEKIKRKFSDRLLECSEQAECPVIVIDKSVLLDLAGFLKGKPAEFTMLLDLTCVDYRGKSPRFEMVYHVFSLAGNRRLRIKVPVDENDLRVDSLTPLWKNADWLEREVYDMFGVRFDGHPDMRRIFMYEGFEGYPLRKDYPLRKRQPRIPLRK